MSASSATVLDRIVAETRAEVERRKVERPLDDDVAAPRTGASLLRAIQAPGIGVIAEFKRRSPSAGSLSDAPDLLATLAAYEAGGAAAASILTEGPNFGGALADLEAAAGASSLPLLRKDFVVDRYQLLEARAAGADAVLLIVAALSAADLAALHAGARELGFDVLVEVHDERELSSALELEAELIGVNNRDLRDFTVELARTESLLPLMPAGVSVISESGIHSPQQLVRLEGMGVAGVLVGETLMRAADPAAALRTLRGG